MPRNSTAALTIRNLTLLRQERPGCFKDESSDGTGEEGARSDTGNDARMAAAQLLEAAYRARQGDCETAKAHIARASAHLRGDPYTTSSGVHPLNHRAPQVLRGGLALWQARRLTAHIDTHLAETIRIEDLAALLGLSVGHFCRAFKATFRVSAHTYLTHRRIEVAQFLMLTTHEPLGGIALTCGMSDQSHFTRLFRRIVGETPHAWRRLRRGALEDEATNRAYSLPKRFSHELKDSAFPLRAPARLSVTPLRWRAG